MISHTAGRRGERATSTRQFLQALGLLMALLVVFLWKPLTTNGYYAPSDLLQSSPLLDTAPDDYRIGNVLLTDPVQQMLPWLEWNRDQLRSGDLPVWNPYNAGGTPHLASMVSAVFSPFSAPHYLLGFRAALVVTAGLKLLVLGLFTYLYLRRVRVSHLGGLVGGVAFMFSGFHILWLSWPHAAATVCLPVGLWLAEVALAAPSPARARMAWGGYALAVAASLFGGHPETMFFAWGLVLAYVPLRLLLSADLRTAAVRRVAQFRDFVVAGALGVALAGIQLLPFWEYLSRSTSYVEGAKRGTAHFEPRFSALHFFPNLFGGPHQQYNDPAQLATALRFGDMPVQSNYNESVSFYIGAIVLLLAGLGVASLLRRRRFVPIFMTVAAALWVAYAHDLGGPTRWLASLPLFELSPRNRTHSIWLFSVACLAGFGIDAVWGARSRRQRMVVTLGVGAAATLVLAIAVAAKRDILDRTHEVAGSLAATPLAEASVHPHLKFVAITFAVAVAAIAVFVAFGRDHRIRVASGVVVIGMIFTQSGWLLRSYNPTVAPGYFFPETPDTELLAGTVGTEVVATGALLSADTNLWYRLRSPDSYDGLGVFRPDNLRRRLTALAAAGSPQAVKLANERYVDTLGVRYVVSQVYPFALPAATLPSGPEFVATLDGLHTMSVYAVPTPGVDGSPCVVNLELIDVASTATVATGSAPCRLPFTTIDFPTVDASNGRSYLARFSGTAQVGGLVPWAGGMTGLRQLDGPDQVALFRVPNSPPRYFSPGAAAPAGTDDDALGRMLDPSFDMDSVALIHAPVTSNQGRPGRVEVLSEQPTEIRLRVTRPGPGWMVAMQTSYPGWEATVDGRPTPLHRADYAYSAVEVGAGTSEVVLRYRPSSVRYGLAATGSSAVALAGWVAFPLLAGRRRRRRSRSEPAGVGLEPDAGQKAMPESSETITPASQVPHNLG